MKNKIIDGGREEEKCHKNVILSRMLANTQLPCIVEVGVNNSFLGILLHKCTFLVSTMVTHGSDILTSDKKF